MNVILWILRWWWERTTHRAALGSNVGENDLKCDKVFLLHHGIGMLIFQVSQLC